MNDIHIYRNGRIEIREPREYEAPQVSESQAWPPRPGEEYGGLHQTFTTRHWLVTRRRQDAHGVQILVEL